MDDKVRGRIWKSLSIDLPCSTISLLSDKFDETQASLSLASGVQSVVINVASYATFNINFILNSEEKLSLINTGLKTETVLCLSFLRPCFVLIQKFGYFFHDQHC